MAAAVIVEDGTWLDRLQGELRGLLAPVFADRPQREVGHMTSRQFVANWAEGDDSFAENPPNAVLSFAEPGDRLPRMRSWLFKIRTWTGDALSYGIKLLDGTVLSLPAVRPGWRALGYLSVRAFRAAFGPRVGQGKG